MIGGPILRDGGLYGRPYANDSRFLGAPFVGGLLGGVLGSALVSPYFYGRYPFGYPYGGVPYGGFGGYGGYGGFWY